MNNKNPADYEIHDFLMDDSFINYHFKRNTDDYNLWTESLTQNPDLKPKADQAVELLQMLSLSLPEDEFRKELQRLEESISKADHTKSIGKLDILPRRTRWAGKSKLTYFLVAASVLIVGIGYVVFKDWGKKPSLISVTNNNEKPLEFELTDGTSVKLKPHSSLQYPGDFNEKERKVYLEGEASFHVKRDTHHPFKVFAGDLVATVLGTVFNIEKNPADSTESIELLSGSLKVDVNDSENAQLRTIYLKPKERIIYKHSTGDFFKERWSRDTPINRTANDLVFKNANFAAVARKVKEAYGIILINNSKKKNWNYNAEFTNAEFKEVLENMCVVEGLKSFTQRDSVFLR
jgi:ferric-dicitrate binding protein FerR (iron transport regulator)